jgi:hypothetical protein
MPSYVDDVVYTDSEDAWKGRAGGLRRRDRVVSGVTANGVERQSRWFEET